MIVKLFKAGKSFKSLGAYLLHDVKDRTKNERVAWTHSRNCAHDHAESAIDEMLWTYRAADDLKRQAGIGAGGRKLENPVRHLSLNWHTSERPTREQMIEAADGFLKHMGWHEHQALLVGHQDREHRHVHIILNAVHPETGLVLDSSLERRRAQVWAREYEREHELVWCEERLKPQEERTQSPTRQSWEILRETEGAYRSAEFERVAKGLDDFAARREPKTWQDKEWQTLKEHQKKEREQFFMEGKEAYRDARNQVFREVRTEFRDEWRFYYEARRAGVDRETLKEIKDDILKDQNAILKERGDAACKTLREERDRQYDAVLDQQRQQREELQQSQGRGEHAYWLLDTVYTPMSPILPTEREGSSAAETLRDFHHANAEITGVPIDDRPEDREHGLELPGHAGDGAKGRDAADLMGALGGGLVNALAGISDSLTGGPTRDTHRHLPPDRGPSLSEEERERARRAAEAKARTEAREAEAAALVAAWEERKQRRRERD